MRAFFAVFCFALLLSSPLAAQTPELQITDLQVMRPLPGQTVSAGYFNLTNPTTELVTLLSVESAQASRVELHETMNMNGMMHMHAVQSVHIEPGQSLAFSRGGKHLMVFDLDNAALEAGVVELTFHFANGQRLTAQAELAAW